MFKFFGILFLAMFASTAIAEEPKGVRINKALLCGEAVQMESVLIKKYNELPIMKANTSLGTVVIIYNNSKNATMTILEVFPNGKACELTDGADLKYLKFI